MVFKFEWQASFILKWSLYFFIVAMFSATCSRKYYRGKTTKSNINNEGKRQKDKEEKQL